MVRNFEWYQEASLWTLWLSRIFPRESRPMFVGRLEYRPSGTGQRFLRKHQTKKLSSSIGLELGIGEACE